MVSSLEAVKQCVAAGLGIAFVPGISAARDIARGDLAEVHMDVPLPTIGYHLVHRRGAGTADLTARLLQSLRATSRRLP